MVLCLRLLLLLTVIFLPVFFLAMTHRLPSKRKRHDEALEDYQAAYVKYEKQRTKLLDWIKTQHENNYNRVHQDEPSRSRRPANQSSLTSTSQALCKNKAS